MSPTIEEPFNFLEEGLPKSPKESGAITAGLFSVKTLESVLIIQPKRNETILEIEEEYLNSSQCSQELEESIIEEVQIICEKGNWKEGKEE